MSRNIAPVKLEMLLVVVHDKKTAYFSSLIQQQQANLQITMPCKGTTHLLLNYRGLTDRPKTLIMSVVREDESASLVSLLDETFKKGGDYKGIALTVPFSSMIGALAYGFLSNEKQIKENS